MIGCSSEMWLRWVGKPGGGDRLRDVASRNRAVELPGFAGLANDDEALAVEHGRLVGGVALEFVVARLEIGALALELLLVRFGGAQGLAARQQEIPGEAVLDAHRVAHMAELGDALQQNHFHDILL